MKYRSRTVEVEANQFHHPATAPIGVRAREDGSAYVVTIHGQETDVAPGDWIVLEDPPGDGTRAYPCKPDVFERKYHSAGDDEEPVDPDFLLKVGFTGGNDEPDTDVYDLSAGNAGLCIRVVLRFARQEIVASHLSLAWTYRFGAGPGRTTLSYQILDDPTQGDVQRLIAALGIEASVARSS